MKTLILVDLDNVLRPGSIHRAERWYLPASDGLTLTPWEPGAHEKTSFVTRMDDDLPDDGAVVVVAFHELTARVRGGVPLRANYLLDLARHLADRARVRGQVRVEAIPVRAVPQAADLAILTALQRASHPSNSGGFARVLLHSRDVGLREAVELRLPPSQFIGRRTRSPVLPEHDWRLAIPHFRSAQRPATGRGATPKRPIGWSARVETDEHVTAVSSDVIQWDPSLEFSNFDRADWRRRSEHFSLLGPTSQSARGVARLGELASSSAGAVALGEVEVGDGVEIQGDRFATGRPSDVLEATSGIGAVRFPDLQATLPTKLPLPVVHEAITRSALELRAPTLTELGVLSFSRGRRIYQPSPAYIVRVRRRKFEGGDAISFSLDTPLGAASAWWWDKTMTPASASERSHALPKGWRVTEMLAEACLAARYGCEVCVAAPDIAEVSVRRFHPGWEIVTARSGRREALVLLPPPAELGRQLRDHGPLEVRRIQRVSNPPSGWPYHDDFWHFLARMPLLVPRQWVTGSVVSTPGVAR